MKLINRTVAMLIMAIAVIEKLIGIADDITTYSKEGSESFLNEARIERAKALKDLRKEIGADPEVTEEFSKA